ncbi:MAG: glucose-6-phosphate isomerase [Flavobacteriaceae bacterium]|nr:glucose-6-phosphate isomerase [Flavobacteriaceae bacterium]|tara:strand:- start:12067 stop:13662 length:1596 start_codon:yes stop_codon:yes gene_type:complete
MSLKSTNPTKSNSWNKLRNHFNDIKDIHIYDMFMDDIDRAEKLSLSWQDFYFDFSKNKINSETINLFNDLLIEIDFKSSIEKYFTGEKINSTESRAVLHTALRTSENQKILVDEKNIIPEIKTVKEKIKSFTTSVHNGNHKGFKGDKITDVVNIGIGGSHLGPSMVVESLSHYKTDLNTHFISNVDGDHLYEVLYKVKPETTLFIIVSKTFTTIETLTNANSVRSWFLKTASENDISKHFIAVSSNVEKAIEYGISSENIFPMWDWVGGRFSLWSSVGLSICLSIGYKKFNELLEGARNMDMHFRNNDFSENIPVLMACLSLWYNNFFNYQTHAIIPYSENLKSFSKYLQQASMESNGKQTDRSNNLIDYETGQIIWGQTGTNAQHSFFQLLHQGSKVITSDFIGFKNSIKGNQDHHDILMANFFAQTKALMKGTMDEEVKTNHKLLKGDRPTNSILINKLTPASLGSLIAIYEHKIFTLGIIWNIFSFDQFGVELGKKLADKILENIENQDFRSQDSSTKNLLKRYSSTD